jgi:hypothetical protein
MDDMGELQSSNINALWLQNVYENIKNLENLERMAREGCTSLMEYLSIPMDTQKIISADVQYKNLRFIVTETHLLLGDLTPILSQEKLKVFRDNLKQVQKVLENRKLFVKETYSVSKNGIVSSKTTEVFMKTVEFLSELKLNILQEISHILYIKDEPKGVNPYG